MKGNNPGAPEDPEHENKPARATTRRDFLRTSAAAVAAITLAEPRLSDRRHVRHPCRRPASPPDLQRDKNKQFDRRLERAQHADARHIRRARRQPCAAASAAVLASDRTAAGAALGAQYRSDVARARRAAAQCAGASHRRAGDGAIQQSRAEARSDSDDPGCRVCATLDAGAGGIRAPSVRYRGALP